MKAELRSEGPLAREKHRVVLVVVPLALAVVILLVVLGGRILLLTLMPFVVLVPLTWMGSGAAVIGDDLVFPQSCPVEAGHDTAGRNPGAPLDGLSKLVDDPHSPNHPWC